MSDLDATALLDLVAARRGHFRLESGYHGALWLDLDALFADARAVDPLVTRLADALGAHAPDLVCGPLLGGAFLAQLVALKLGVPFCFTERVPDDVADGGALFRARYALPRAFADRVRGERVALVDDVVSAGSSLRATDDVLVSHGATIAAVGALLLLGDAGADHFDALGIPVEAPLRAPYEIWPPDACPLCAAHVPLESGAA